MNRRRGFTLIEVLVTSTIAAMLITSVIGLTFRLERQRRVLQARYQNLNQTEILRATIRNDFMQSEMIVVGQGQLVPGPHVTCIGGLSTDSVGEATSHLASASYFISDNALYREEQCVETKRELLWSGADRIEFTQGELSEGRARMIVLDKEDKPIIDVTCLLRSPLHVGVAR